MAHVATSGYWNKIPTRINKLNVLSICLALSLFHKRKKASSTIKAAWFDVAGMHSYTMSRGCIAVQCLGNDKHDQLLRVEVYRYSFRNQKHCKPEVVVCVVCLIPGRIACIFTGFVLYVPDIWEPSLVNTTSVTNYGDAEAFCWQRGLTLPPLFFRIDDHILEKHICLYEAQSSLNRSGVWDLKLNDRLANRIPNACNNQQLQVHSLHEGWKQGHWSDKTRFLCYSDGKMVFCNLHNSGLYVLPKPSFPLKITA